MPCLALRTVHGRGLSALALGLALALVAAGAGGAAEAAAPDAIVGDGVLAAVAAHEKPKVVIYIEPQDVDDAAAAASASQGEAHRRAVIAAAQDRILAAGAAGFTLHRRFAGVPALAGAVDAKALARIRREPGVKRIDLELEAHADLAQSVPLIKADLVRSLGYRGQGMTVGVIDTGIDTDNVDLSDNIEAQACLCLADGGCCPNGGTSQFGPGSAEDNNGHGTHVSGIITSKGIVAPIGVAPDANIVMIKVLDAQGSTCCMSDIVAALDYIHDHQPTVDSINISIGSNAMYGGDCDNADASNMALADAIGALRVAGVPVFVSAGNAGSSAAMSSPACISAAVSVGATYDANVGGLTFGGVPCTDATTAADKIACYSNTDSSTNLLAPGGAITSTYINGQIATLYGTSMAAPHAAACAALLKQADPTLNAAAIETALEATGKKITDPRNNLTFPRIDCLAALQSQACPDADHDGFWAPNPPMCPGPPFSDCNDSDPSIYPGNVEICDFKDNNCNGLVDEGFDPDNDGLVSCADNCPNDYNPDQNDFDHDGQGDACDLDDGVIQVTVPDGLQVSWQMETPYTSFNLYRGDLRSLVDADRNGAADDYGACLAENLSGPTFGDQTAPPVGHGYIYLVDANLTSGETSLGNASSGAVRPNVHDCRSVFGSPPVVSSVSGTTSTQTVTCDITIFSQDRLCLLGVPGAQAMAPILVQGSYTEARLLAQVTDPEGPADLSEVRATLAASTGGNSDLLLYDDASQTVLPEPQRWSDSGEDCGATASCGCPIKVYALSSGDASAADGTSTRVFGLVSASLPAIVQDCVMQARARYPMVAATGAQFTATVTATDRESHTGTSTQQPTFSTGAGSYACSGDPCGCCLLLATDPGGQCKGLAGMTSPDFPAGVCKSL
jgi:subtilisin family serine protease